MKLPRSIRVLCLVFALVFTSPPARAVDDCYVIQSRPSSSLWQLFLHLKDDGSILSPDNALFGVEGGFYGAAFHNGTFYGIELENGTFIDYLCTVPHSGSSLRSRVSGNSIGFPNVEALASVEGQLIAASLDFDAIPAGGHTTRFISVDPATGVGSLIGVGSVDVMIVGLAYDPIAGVLYGAGMPYGSNQDYKLYTINPATGATTLVGTIGVPIQSLAVSPSLGLVGGMQFFHSIDPTTGTPTQIGTTDFTLGLGVGPGLFNGLYAMAAIPPVAPATVEIVSVGRTLGGEFEITWASQAGCTYQVEKSATLEDSSWSAHGPSRPGSAGTMSATASIGSTPQFFHVVKTVP